MYDKNKIWDCAVGEMLKGLEILQRGRLYMTLTLTCTTHAIEGCRKNVTG